MLTQSQWDNQQAPMFYMDVSCNSWGAREFDAIDRWLDERCGGWWFRFGSETKTFVFGNSADRMVFRMWISSNPLSAMDTL